MIINSERALKGSGVSQEGIWPFCIQLDDCIPFRYSLFLASLFMNVRQRSYQLLLTPFVKHLDLFQHTRLNNVYLSLSALIPHAPKEKLHCNVTYIAVFIFMNFDCYQYRCFLISQEWQSLRVYHLNSSGLFNFYFIQYCLGYSNFERAAKSYN